MGEFSESQLIFIFCSVPAMWSLSSSNECNKLKIMIGDTEVPTTDFCKKEYLTKECKDFVGSFNATFLPHSLVQTNSYSLEKPSSIKVEGLLSPPKKLDLGGVYPGARIQWTSPFSEISRAHLKGFLLFWEWITNGTSDSRCRLFEFNSSNEMRLEMLTFTYDISYVKSSAEIHFNIYSIPPPRSELKNNPETFVRATLTSFAGFGYKKEEGWEPDTEVRAYGNGSIEVVFQLSPPEFNFTEFRIELIDSNNPGVVFQHISYIGNVMSFYETQGMVVFTDIPAGSFHIKVYPVDQYWNDEKKCVCCQGNCAYFYTKLFENIVADTDKEASTVKTRFTRNLEDTVPSEFFSSIAHVRADIFNARAETGMSSMSDARADNVIGFREEQINILLIVFSVLLVGMIALVVCLLCNPKSAGVLKKFFIRLCSRVKDSPTPTSLPQLTVPTTGTHHLPTLRSKKLYFLSADDHSHHIHIIECLINYLELHCYCNVVYPTRAEDIHNYDSPYSWFINHISSSDHIIFVNSVGAQKLIEANLNKTVYRNRVLGPEGDLFTECVKHFFKDNKARDKVINIFFEGNQNESRYIASSFTFQIPRNLPEFVLKLHSLNLKDKEKYNSRLPLERDTISTLPGGAELLTALEASKHFELDNPNWLEQNFGEPTSLEATYKSPQLESASGDSGINEFNPLSVSTTSIHDGVEDFFNTRGFQHYDTFLAEYSNTRANQDNNVYNNNQELPFSIVSVPISNFSHEVNNNHKAVAPATDPDHGTNNDNEKNEIFMNMKEGEDQEDFGVSGAYSKPRNERIDSFVIAPPETMSAITNMSAEMANINRQPD